MALEVQIEKQLGSYTLSVELACGSEPLAVLGPSGAGKSMTLRCIAGLEKPQRGRITLEGRKLFDSERGINLPSRARRVGLVFQHYALFPHMTVAENVQFGLGRLSPAERDEQMRKQLARTHLAGLERRLPRELSGGEQQRVALGRALATEPEALLLDEPLSALDTHLRGQIEAQLIESVEEYKRPTLFVTHNMEEAYRVAKNLLVLSRGKVVANGPKEEIFRHPPTKEVALLTGCKNISRARGISANTVEATDWNCTVRVARTLEKPAAYVGIRAHHLDFANAGEQEPAGTNAFPCWLVQASETPFRITLYLKLHRPPEGSWAHDLQAEVFKEKWARFRELPQPWTVRLDPESLFLLPE